jgi:hypothetical protein
VDESGNQIAVFARRGARPFNREEASRLFLRDGAPYTVPDEPPNKPLDVATSTESDAKPAPR